MKTKKTFRIIVKPNSSYFFKQEVFFTKAYTEKQAKIVILEREQLVRSLKNRDLCDIAVEEIKSKSLLNSQETINQFLNINYDSILEYSKIMEIE